MLPWYLILPAVLAVLVMAGYGWLAIQYDRNDPAIRKAFADEDEQPKVTS